MTKLKKIFAHALDFSSLCTIVFLSLAACYFYCRAHIFVLSSYIEKKAFFEELKTYKFCK